MAALAACGPYVQGDAVATHTAGDVPQVDPSAVRISALAVPTGAAELGIVQAHVIGGSIEDAMPEFQAQVAKLGGDFGKVNDVTTKFEMQTRQRTETYNCGSSDKPQTCSRSVTETVEVATTRILGKAYRLNAAPTKPTTPAEPAQAADTPAPAAPPSAAQPAATPPAEPPAGPEGATFPP